MSKETCKQNEKQKMFYPPIFSELFSDHSDDNHWQKYVLLELKAEGAQ